MLAVFTLKSSCSDDKMKEHMKSLAETDTALTAKLVKLQEQQNKTALDIGHFNTLLDKTSVILTKDSELVVLSTMQIDSFKNMSKSVTRQVHVMIDQYNHTIGESNDRRQKELLTKVNEYNDLATAMNELEPDIHPFRVGRDNSIIITSTDVKKRLGMLDILSKNLKVLTKTTSLMAFNGLDKLLDSCYNGIGRYKSAILYNISVGAGDIDTSFIGQKLFSDVVYNYLNLEDSIGAHIEEYRDKATIELRNLEKVIDSNNRMMNHK